MSHPALAASVVVPTHHGAHRLPVLLDALATQETDRPWEVVVVVDGPDADTERLLQTVDAGLPLVVVRRERSVGVAAALNAGVDAASGRVVIRCDDDLTPAPDMVARHLAHHDGDELVGVIGPTLDVHADTPYARAYGRAAGERAVTAVLAAPEEDRWRHWAGHCSVRRDAFLAVGGYDPSFSYREDSELGLRLVGHGVRIVVDESLALPHRGAPADARTKVTRAWVSGASEVLLRQRHPELGTRAAPGPSGAADRLWRGATGALSRAVPGREAAARVGGALDRALPHLPVGAGGRLTAMAVEAAALAGSRRGSADQSGYRGQKDAELAAERERGGERGPGLSAGG